MQNSQSARGRGDRFPRGHGCADEATLCVGRPRCTSRTPFAEDLSLASPAIRPQRQPSSRGACLLGTTHIALRASSPMRLTYHAGENRAKTRQDSCMNVNERMNVT